jgi:hypothetical protein
MISVPSLDNDLILEVTRPVQFLGIWKGRTATTPERRLLLAMIAQAAGDLRLFRGDKRPKSRRMYNDAHDWVVSNDKSHMFSFVSICDILGFSTTAIRAALLNPTRQTAIAA